MSCCNGNGSLGLAFTPSFCGGHELVGVVPQSEMLRLIKKGFLSLYNGGSVREIYDHPNRIGIICGDASIGDAKRRLLGENAFYVSDAAAGLRFDPHGPFKLEFESRIENLKETVHGAGRHFKVTLIVFGAHFPCGASGSMTLEEVIRSVAAAFVELKKVFPDKEIIPTIFVTTEVNAFPELSDENISKQNMLFWARIHPENILKNS